MQEVAEAQPIPEVKGRLTRRGRAFVCGDHEKGNGSEERINEFKRLSQKHPWFGGLSIVDLVTIWQTDEVLREEAWKALCARRKVPLEVWKYMIIVSAKVAPEYTEQVEEKAIGEMKSERLIQVLDNDPVLTVAVGKKLVSDLSEYEWRFRQDKRGFTYANSSYGIRILIERLVTKAPILHPLVVERFLERYPLEDNTYDPRNNSSNYEENNDTLTFLLKTAQDTAIRKKLALILSSRKIDYKSLSVLLELEPEFTLIAAKQVVSNADKRTLRWLIEKMPAVRERAAKKLLENNITNEDIECVQKYAPEILESFGLSSSLEPSPDV